MPNQPKLHFFLGANTPQGFVSRFDQLGHSSNLQKLFVIKGGPGSGKSTMMKRIAVGMEEEGFEVERIHCSSDADSLDAVIIPKLGCAIADGTAPHVIEPKYPGVFETVVPVFQCWDEAVLRQNQEEILALFARTSLCHEHCCRFLSAAGSVANDTYRIALECTDTIKLGRYARRVAAKEFKLLSAKPGTERVRFFSAVTNRGVVPYYETVGALCDRLYIIDDEHGAVSRLLLGELRAIALSSGYDVVSCYCPLSPFEKLEHLFIPEIRLGFMTSNRYHPVEREAFRMVNSRRFVDTDALKLRKKRLTFNRKACLQLVNEASARLAEAKNTHDQLEQFYIQATDFSKVAALGEGVFLKMQSLAHTI